MQGNAGFAKMDFTLSPKQLAFVRLSTSRFSGTNNVFFDPSSPITELRRDGERKRRRQDRKRGGVADQRLDQQPGHQPAAAVLPRPAAVDSPTPTSRGPRSTTWSPGFGGSSMLPRDTREHKLHIADTLSYETGRACTGSLAAISSRRGSTTTTPTCSAANITSTTSR